MPAVIRPAAREDLPAVAAIYDRIHDAEEAGRITTGWIRGVYPTEATARAALAARDLYVLRADGRAVASARINHAQMPEYARVPWRFPAPEDEVLVLHTLTVDPAFSGRGYGRLFLEFYEALALERGCRALRMDTNARNAAARAMYAHHGYFESGIIPTVFNGIPGVDLVCLEKPL